LPGDWLGFYADWAATCRSQAEEVLSKNGAERLVTCDKDKLRLSVTCNGPCEVTRARGGGFAVAPQRAGTFSFAVDLHSDRSGETVHETSPEIVVRGPDAVSLRCPLSDHPADSEPCGIHPIDGNDPRVIVAAELDGRAQPVKRAMIEGHPVTAGRDGYVSWRDFAPEAMDGPRVRVGIYQLRVEALGVEGTSKIEVRR
jgi:hypothetical protein